MKKLYFVLAAFFLLANLNAQIITIPDANLKSRLLNSDSMNSIAINLSGNYFKIDANNNSEIEVNEALLVRSLDLSYANISSLAGITYFSNMEGVHLGFNNLSGSLNLAVLLPDIKELYINNNNLQAINVLGMTNLETLECGSNILTQLNVSGLPNLYMVQSRSCQLTSLNVANCPNLSTISCDYNLLTTLDVSGLLHLNTLQCNNNLLTTLNINGLPYLTTLECMYNNINTLYIKNGILEYNLWIGNNPLAYVCCDESQIQQVQNILTIYDINNCAISSYCSFHPGGIFYTVQGANKYDVNADGCEPTDAIFPGLKFNITNGSITGTVISNTSGNYSIPVEGGSHILTPQLENPAYFNVTPSSQTFDFPTTTSPAIQNFCITPNGVHNDLEIAILPINNARPGFDIVYKLIYKNKGNQIQSGNIVLTFNDSVLDLVSATPVVLNQVVNSLSWNFTNLAPFETKEILITLNLNSPTETPPVNSGFTLNFNASVFGSTDETPINNTVSIAQGVINSLDPNDKRCLEGNTITPSMVGKDVHYIIRFENNGTANAQNIVVKDLIDASKYEINSLIPLHASHSFITRISDTNKVEFIFENINLPFDNANNDGYVAFKIKTKPTLVVGDTFSNAASIYFDYNFPIVTNTATTVIQALGTSDFEFDTYFTLAPNPAKEVLNIQVKNDVGISSISIYNTIGQLVLVVTEPSSSIDVSSLKVGNYFIKVFTDKGSSSSKFIKE